MDDFATPSEIANALQRDMGIEAAIGYAARKAQTTDPGFAAGYSGALAILRRRSTVGRMLRAAYH